MRKSMLPLAIVAAVLVGLVIIKNSREEQVSIVDQANLAALVPEDLAESDVARIELYGGAAPDDKIVLARAEDGDSWLITSHFDAPADDEKMNTFLENLVTLKGEYRSTAEDAESLSTWELGDEEALHVTAYEEGAESPALHVLVGKSPNFQDVFIRKAGEMEVYIEDTNLRSEAGVRGEEIALEAQPWLDKQVLEIAREDIEGVTIETPSKKLVFNKETTTPETPEAEEPAEGEEAAATPPPAPETKWVLAEGGPGTDFKQATLDNMVNKIAALQAANVVDPAQKAEYGLEPAMFTATVKIAGQEEPIVVKGGRKDPAGVGYVSIASSDKDIVYEIAKFNFDPLFPKGGDLFTLEGVTLSGDVTRIEMTQPEGRIVVAKEGENWNVVEPVVALPLQNSAINTVATALKNWAPADYATSTEGTGLDSPDTSVTFSSGDETYTILLGGDSDSIDGRYAKVEGRDQVLAMSRTDVDRIFRDPSQFFQLALVDGMAADFQSFTVNEGGTSLTLTREGEGWSLQVNGEPAPREVDAQAANDLAQAFAGLQAESIAFGQTGLEGDAVATVTATKADGTPVTLRFGPAADGVHPAVVEGMEQRFNVAAVDFEELTPDADALMVAAPETAAEAPAETPPPAIAAPDAAAPADAAPAVTVTPAEEAPAEEPPAEEPPADEPAADPAVEEEAAPEGDGA